MASRVVIWLVLPWLYPACRSCTLLDLLWDSFLLWRVHIFFFFPETDANLFLALVCSSLPLSVHVWLLLLPPWHWPPEVPGKFRFLFFLFKSLFFLSLVYAEHISGKKGVAGQPASQGLALCCPLGATFYRPIREPHRFHFWQRKALRSTFFYLSLPHLSSCSSL